MVFSFHHNFFLDFFYCYSKGRLPPMASWLLSEALKVSVRGTLTPAGTVWWAQCWCLLNAMEITSMVLLLWRLCLDPQDTCSRTVSEYCSWICPCQGLSICRKNTTYVFWRASPHIPPSVVVLFLGSSVWYLGDVHRSLLNEKNNLIKNESCFCCHMLIYLHSPKINLKVH